MTVDRSISIAMLEYLDRHSTLYLTKGQLSEMYASELLDAGISKRVEEQLRSGTISQSVDGYKITSKGRGIAALFRAVRSIFLLPEPTLR